MRKVLTVVHCYQGDAELVESTLPWHWRHGPVLVLSPTDSPVKIKGVECRSAGLRGWCGAQTVERQYLHWKIAAEHAYAADWFLLNDADSFALRLPEYVFDPDVFWSNYRTPYPDNDSLRDVFYTQPPFFMSRRVLEKFIAAGLPLQDRIDEMYASQAKALGIPGKPYQGPPWNRTFVHPKKHARYLTRHEQEVMEEEINAADAVSADQARN